ncbi:MULTISPECIES: hypothetical protein [Trichocoleus]|uniref:Uncharacterized protein n=1 Tax=Trichocoleus desertorum GB2-A4 TaxID=2933944 RepID=A0ABV0JCY5_9CYAN|nr:hypothetical protein [Trichocoleus sp. FACHB-46]MBD1864161.1 hypothetical protein [Trichocoleus sp. FACHB-46]
MDLLLIGLGLGFVFGLIIADIIRLIVSTTLHVLLSPFRWVIEAVFAIVWLVLQGLALVGLITLLLLVLG